MKGKTIKYSELVPNIMSATVFNKLKLRGELEIAKSKGPDIETMVYVESIPERYKMVLIQKGLRNQNIRNSVKGRNPTFGAHKHHKQPIGTTDTTRRSLYQIQDLFRAGNQRLQRIAEMLLNELTINPDCLPTSLLAVERELAICISECLSDVPEQKRNTHRIQVLLHDYKVVVPLRGSGQTVSLNRIHLLCQDNYKNSCFCKLLNILLAGFMNCETLTIDF